MTPKYVLYIFATYFRNFQKIRYLFSRLWPSSRDTVEMKFKTEQINVVDSNLFLHELQLKQKNRSN